MWFKSSVIRLLLCSAFVFASHSQATELDKFDGLSGTVNIAGGTAHIPVMKQAAKSIMKANHDIKITIAGGGSGVGAQQVAKGLVNMATQDVR